MPNPKMAIFFFLFFFFLYFFLFFFLMAIFFLFLYKVTHWIAFLKKIKIKIEADWKVIYLTAFLPFANFTRPGHYLITPMLLRVSL
jgi:hypothetical protein